ncbi:hypothetical protein EU534_00175 [Candidatus Heimdallarchaeota archaeon]|nr:MAG: hypothetical protein EU534_00175 [Candidatus Heimdallarchaeota archaeon]
MLRDKLEFMKLKERLQNAFHDKMSSSQLEKLPAGYSVLGDIAIFHHIDESLRDFKQLLGELILEFDSNCKVVVEQLNTLSPFRTPIINHIAGEFRTRTIHREFKTDFHLDIAEITLSPGNKRERERLIREVQENEIICDMFACIGNLSLPVVVNNISTTAYGIEWNQVAYKFLEMNIKANNVSNRYYPIFGDNRNNTPINFASRVLMGFFGSDETQFNCALEALKDEGWIHYHSISSRDSMKEPEKYIKKIRKTSNFDIQIKEIRRVKKFSPTKQHLCTDIYVTK